MTDHNYSAFLQTIAWMTPMLLTYLVGMMVSIFLISRLGTPAILTLVGCGLMCLGSFVGMSTSYYQLTWHAGVDPERADFHVKLVQVFITSLDIVGFALILTAVFVGRKNPNAVGER